MKITIWGARGSIPAPAKPEYIRGKIVSALLGLGTLAPDRRKTLLAAIDQAESIAGNLPKSTQEAIDTYLNSLSPLTASTASGNTPCIEIRSGNDLFIIDAGSGIRDLGIELMKGPWGQGQGVIHLFFSHPHWDHIQGFPFFRPAFIPGNKLFIYSVHDMETALRRQQEVISFPVSLDYMQATRVFKRLNPNQVLSFGDLRIRNICNQHPGDAYSYRFEKGAKAFVYASDASFPDGMDQRPYLNFFSEADVLIFDAQFTQRESDEKEDWGHSSSFVGVEMAQQANVKTLVLFHYDPTYTDQDLEKILKDTLKFQQNQYPTASPVHVMMAQEGQTFDLTPRQSTKMQRVPGSGAAILKPVGIFDEHVAAQLRDQLEKMDQREWPSQLIIDLTEVEMLQVAGLRGLVKLRKENQATPMALAAPSINVEQLIELAGYRDFFATYPSVHVALTALKAREKLQLPGQILKKRYKIESKIGDGQLGTVFKATDTQNKQPVAIKILSPSFSEIAIKQFLQQARQIVNLVHPNIVTVYDCDEDRGISFMAEELIDSQTLQEVIDSQQGQPMPLNVALGIAQKIIKALEYAHSHGVVHGDLKPENVLLADNGIKISDFGLGRLEGGKALLNIDMPMPLISARYLAPEQVLGQPVDIRTDLYALGAILYEMFTGAPIFEGTDQKFLEFQRGRPPKSPRALNAALSRPLEHLILKLLEKEPDKRYAAARQVRHILNSMSVVSSQDRYPRGFTVEHWPSLVGRDQPMQQLNSLWAATNQGQGQVVLLSGPTGAGRSRLVQEFAANLNDATVLFGICHKTKRCPAYQPLRIALKSYLANTPAPVAGQNVSQVWRLLTDLVPEIKEIIPELESPAFETPTAAGDWLQAIAEIGRKKPWLLVFDDLHWSDSSTLKLVEYLASHVSRLPLMVVVIFNRDVAAKSKYFEPTLNWLDQQPHCTAITLDLLNQAETQSLLENFWTQPVPADLVTTIYSRTQGNPFFIETIANDLIDEGVINWRNDKWYFGPLVEMGLSKSTGAALQRRIERLSRETQTLLSQGAVLGPRFSFEDLHEVSDLSEWDALESISIAMERQLVKCGPGDHLLHFSHPLIQQVLLNGLSSLKQRLLHREAGEALERRYLPDTRETNERLAHHFFNAGELEKGLSYSVKAARQARQLYANDNALFWYTQALDAMDQLNPDLVPRTQRFELLLARELLYHTQGIRNLQRADLSSLQQLAQKLGDPAKQAVVHLRQAAYELAVNNLAEAATETQTALIAARHANSPALESECLTQLAAIALAQAQFDTARRHLHAAQHDLVETHYKQIEARRLNSLGLLHALRNDPLNSEPYFEAAIAASRQGRDRQELALYLSNLADVLHAKREFSAALNTQEQALMLAQLVSNIGTQALCLNRLARLHRDIGSYNQARSYAEQARVLHRTIENEQGQAADLRTLGAIHLTGQDYVTARDLIGQALEIFQRSRNKTGEWQSWLDLGLALEGLGHRAKAIQAYEQAQQVTDEVQLSTPILDAKIGIARCQLTQGQTEAARQIVATCLKTLDSAQPFLPCLVYPAHFYLTAYQVLQAANDPGGANAVLQAGQSLLHRQTGALTEPHLRRLFLEAVRENKELMAHQSQPKAETISVE